MKYRNLILFISLPVLMFSCAEQTTSNCQNEKLQIEELKELLKEKDSIIAINSSTDCSLLSSPFDHVAEVLASPANSSSTVMDYTFVYSVYVPRGVSIQPIDFNPNEPGVIWEVQVNSDSVSTSQEPYDRWVTDTLTLPNNMTMTDVNNDGSVTHWNDEVPGSKGELDQSSVFLLVINDPNGTERSKTPYMLKRASIKSL